MTQSPKVQILSRRIRTRLGTAAILQLQADYRKGDTTTTLMERYSLSKTSVLRLLNDANVTLRRQPLTPEQVAEAKLLYERPLSLVAVSEQMQLPRESIRRALIEAGVTMRGRGRLPSHYDARG